MHMPRSLKFAFLVAPLLLAAGCTSDFGPWPMPTGYAYHHSEYHAPPGPEPVFKKWEKKYMNNGTDNAGTMAPMNIDTHFSDDTTAAPVIASVAPATDLQVWQSAADELARRLFGDFGRPNEAVYLQPGSGGLDAFGVALRSALQSQNVKVADNVGGGPFGLRYSAQDMGAGSEGRMLLTVTLMTGATKMAEESGIYSVGASRASGSLVSPSASDSFVGGNSGAPMPITNDRF